MSVKAHGNRTVTPCWRSFEIIGNLQEQSLQEVWSSPAAQKLRNDLLSGKQPKGCQRCWNIENQSETLNISLRHRYNKRYSHFFSDVFDDIKQGKIPKVKSAEFRFSTLCNFRCLHCHPSNSTTWKKFCQENPRVKNIPSQYLDSIPIQILDKEQIDQFLKSYGESLEEFWVCGGEPLMEPLYYYFLDQYPPSSAGKLNLYMSTNLSRLSLKGWDLKKLWLKFKSHTIRVGIDGDIDSYEYFRVGGSTTTLEKNVETVHNWKIPGLSLESVCTVNILNISKIRGILSFSESLDLPLVFTFLNGHPDSLDIRNLPKKWKNQFETEIKALLTNQRLPEKTRSSLNRVLVFMLSREDDPSEIQKLKYYCESLDSHNSLKFNEVYPELDGLWGQ